MGMNYAYLDPKVAKQVMLRMLTQDKVKYIQAYDNDDYWPTIPEDADNIFVTGTLRGCGKVCTEAIKQDANWFYMDNGYGPFWKRVTFKGTAPQRYIERPNDRTPEYEYGKWRGGKGKSILILPPSLPYMKAFDEIDWVNQVIHTINSYTDRPLIIRPKPAKDKKAPPLMEQLEDAYCVVSFGSAIALEAMKMGIPTISWKYCPAKFASFKYEDLETDNLKQEPNREGVINNIMYHSFHKDEFNSGFAWETSMENAYA